VSLFVPLFDQPELRAKFPNKARVMPPVTRGELPVDLDWTKVDKWLKLLGKRGARGETRSNCNISRKERAKLQGGRGSKREGRRRKRTPPGSAAKR
jgi:hypothetical protein